MADLISVKYMVKQLHLDFKHLSLLTY